MKTIKLSPKEVAIIVESLDSDLNHWQGLKGDDEDVPGIDETISDIEALIKKMNVVGST